MYPVFTLVRQVVRLIVLVALIATVLSIHSATSDDATFDTLKTAAENAWAWLRNLIDRLPEIAGIELSDLDSAQGWIDLGKNLFSIDNFKSEAEQLENTTDTTTPPSTEPSP